MPPARGRMRRQPVQGSCANWNLFHGPLNELRPCVAFPSIAIANLAGNDGAQGRGSIRCESCRGSGLAAVRGREPLPGPHPIHACPIAVIFNIARRIRFWVHDEGHRQPVGGKKRSNDHKSGCDAASSFIAASRSSRISEESNFSSCRNHSGPCSMARFGISPISSPETGNTP